MVLSELLNTLIKSYVRVWYNLKLKIFGQINGDVMYNSKLCKIVEIVIIFALMCYVPYHRVTITIQ